MYVAFYFFLAFFFPLRQTEGSLEEEVPLRYELQRV